MAQAPVTAQGHTTGQVSITAISEAKAGQMAVQTAEAQKTNATASEAAEGIRPPEAFHSWDFSASAALPVLSWCTCKAAIRLTCSDPIKADPAL